MRATTMAVCIPAECNRGCPYCVSRMTWAPEPDEGTMVRNYAKALGLAERSGVTDIVLTSKGETLGNMDVVGYFARQARSFSVAVQTAILPSEDTLEELVNAGVNTVALSLDDPGIGFDRTAMLAETCKAIRHLGLISRLTVVLTPIAMTSTPTQWLGMARTCGLRQLSFREVTVPEGREHTAEADATAKWIQEHIPDTDRVAWREKLEEFLSETALKPVRWLPYGAELYDVDGISLTYFKLCVQDRSGEEDIRSLIFHQDGHMYTTWGSRGSIIF